MENLPIYVNISFIVITFLTIYLFYRATQRSQKALWVILGWLVLHGILSYSGFYETTDTIPPRAMLTFFPTFILIIALFNTSSGKAFIDSLDEKALTILHTIRIPVEIVLLLLFLNGLLPEIMTFEGRNFDILAGLTAPFVYYLGYVKNKIGKNGLLIWNILCVVLLSNIVFYALFSIETPFQQFGLDQPNRAILYFPFAWLPAVVVPIVFFSHFATIRKLLNR